VTDLAERPLDELEDIVVRNAEADEPELWLTRVLSSYVAAVGLEDLDEARALFSGHHREFWAWVWAIERGVRPETAFIGVWARGGAKSTSAEAGCVALGATHRRRYGVYVSETQDQADGHVQTIGSMLESDTVERFYPEMSRRLVGKFGNSKGWRRNRLRTASGFTIDALGLDTASRGIKIDDQRPDLIVLDDVDGHDDSPRIVERKLDAITRQLLPAGSGDVAVLGIQNLVQRNGVFARLVDGRARFLARRRVSGPVPAVRGLVTEHVDDSSPGGRDVVRAGTPTWKGQGLEVVQAQIDEWGLAAFLAEGQHVVTRREGALWSPEQLAVVRRSVDVPLDRVVVAVDPSGGDGPDNDAQGIVVAARSGDDGVVLDDRTATLPPDGWGRATVQAALDWEADAVVAEVNYGGAMVEHTITTAAISMGVRPPKVVVLSASRGKRVRAEPVAALYGRPDEPETWSTARVHHCGHFAELEDEMTSWEPDRSAWSPNRVDALVWAFTHLFGLVTGKRRRWTTKSARPRA
jgi:hypothetical protein